MTEAEIPEGLRDLVARELESRGWELYDRRAYISRATAKGHDGVFAWIRLDSGDSTFMVTGRLDSRSLRYETPEWCSWKLADQMEREAVESVMGLEKGD